jgi:hypothetical protein
LQENSKQKQTAVVGFVLNSGLLICSSGSGLFRESQLWRLYKHPKGENKWLT